MRRALSALMVISLLICAQTFAFAENPGSAYAEYLQSGAYPALRQKYENRFLIGVNLSDGEWNSPAMDVIAESFSAISFPSVMRPDFLLARNATKKQDDPGHAALYFDQMDKHLAFAQERGLRVFFHALIHWDEAPKWFFTENWAQGSSARLVDRDTMLCRMENYIRDVITHINTAYPGLVYAWNVVDEALEPAQGHAAGLRQKNNLWLQVIGEDYVEQAFSFARKYASEDQQLLFCDSDCFRADKADPLYDWLKKLKEQGLIDGVGLHGHWALESPTAEELAGTFSRYAALGLSIHITEMDVKETEDSGENQMRLAVRYKSLFSTLENSGLPIRSVVLSSLTDDKSWMNNSREKAYPALFDASLQPKAAYFGALQDESIPDTGGKEACIEALLALNLYIPPKEEQLMVFKTLDQHNPVMVQRFGADPWAMVYNGRVYLYMTGDEPVFDQNGAVQTNTYGNITTLRVVSSDDLVNWQDHGEIPAAGRQGAAKWAANSWAPCAAWKNIDGEDRFFLYFANSGGGIGVLTADDPAGPFYDPLGAPLISRATPTCASVTWLFDPAILLDDDGQAYLYFGGGIPDGQQAAPGTARAVKLGADMISLDGDPVVIDAPWLFEDSGINKMGDTYVYSYCSNFQVPSAGSEQGFFGGEIVYMTSDDPLGPFVYGGRALKNPGSYFGVGGNNHHSMFEFGGQWYIAYHAATVDRQLGWNAGYRSTFVDILRLNENGLPALSEGTLAGVPQLHPLNPYDPIPASTAASMAGVKVITLSEMQSVECTVPGGWIGISQADFGEKGAAYVSFRWKGEAEGTVSILLDDPNSEPCAVIPLAATELWQGAYFTLPEKITGIHDLYIRLERPGLTLNQWRFRE